MGNQFERQQKQAQDEATKKQIKFMAESFSKLLDWQLEHNALIIPYLSGPWMRGVFTITPEITFREMNDEDRQMMQAQKAQNLGIDLPKPSQIETNKVQ